MEYGSKEDSRKQVSATQVTEQTGLTYGLEVNDIEAKRYGQAFDLGITWETEKKIKHLVGR